MKANTMELNLNEMEQANGGTSISEYWQAICMMWDIHNCESGSHEWKWLGELEDKVEYYWPYKIRYKVFECTKCGKKQHQTDDHVIVGTYDW